MDNSNLRHLVENARDFHAAAEIGHLGFEPQRRQPLRHRFHVAADTERPARALQEDDANLVILARPPCRFQQAPHHVRIVRAVHGDREQAVLTFASPKRRQCAGAAAGTPAVDAGRIVSSRSVPDRR